jgi:hypothetical protein
VKPRSTFAESVFVKSTLNRAARAGALSALLCLCLTAGQPARAAVPGTINYQGFLTDAVTGQPLGAPVIVGFSLYDAPNGGNLVYGETQTVTPSSGVFNVQIGSGSGTPVFSSVPFDKPYWIEITIGGQALAPRQPLASAATALRARVAEALAPVPGTGLGNTSIGAGALGVNTSGDNNTASGSYALGANTTGAPNTATGAFALSANTTGKNNVANGYSALSQGNGNGNIGIGYLAGFQTTGDNNIAIGNVGVVGESQTIRIGDSLQTRAFLAGINGVTLPGGQTVVIGNSGQLGVAAVTGTGSGNVAYGLSTLVSNSTGANNTALGFGVLQLNTTGAFNTAAGVGALNANTTGGANVAVGSNALVRNTSGTGNVAVGDGSQANTTTGNTNTALGQNALLQNSIGINNLALGSNAGSALTTGSNNIAIGNVGVVGESQTIRIGDNSLHAAAFFAGVRAAPIAGANARSVVIDSSTGQLGVAAVTGSGTGNVAYGLSSLVSNTTGAYNTAVGISALNANSTGQANVAVGSNALVRNTSGTGNVAVGDASQANTTTGNINTALGQGALVNNSSGSGNLALGQNAGSALTTGSNNIAIANTGVAGESNTIRIGNTVHTATYIAGALYNPSDRNLKQDFAGVDVVDVLNKLVALPVSHWTYKNDDQRSRHLGPVAQDFHAAFGLGADDKHIATIDEGGVALAAIKGLYLKLQASEARSRTKDKELARVRHKAERVDVLEKELAAIKARLGMK